MRALTHRVLPRRTIALILIEETISSWERKHPRPFAAIAASLVVLLGALQMHSLGRDMESGLISGLSIAVAVLALVAPITLGLHLAIQKIPTPTFTRTDSDRDRDLMD